MKKIGIHDNVVDITRHAKLYRAQLRGFWSRCTCFFHNIWGD